MARVTHVKKAQQRYETIPVIDPETGQQKVTPVLRRDGSQKTTKKGKPVVMRVTEADKSQPLPNHVCDKCGKEIEVGQPYKWIAPKSGPYGGSKKYRCGECPTWHLWEYNYSRGAQVARVQYEGGDAISSAESLDDIKNALEEAAGEIRSLADEAEEGANNIEDGFGHETYQSQELREQSESLNSWADECEEWEPSEEEPDLSDFEDEGDESAEDQFTHATDEWLDNIRQEAQDALDSSPI